MILAGNAAAASAAAANNSAIPCSVAVSVAGPALTSSMNALAVQQQQQAAAAAAAASPTLHGLTQ
jgi:hypothetical protein